MADIFTVFTAGKNTNSPTQGFLCPDFEQLNNKIAIKNQQTRFAKYDS